MLERHIENHSDCSNVVASLGRAGHEVALGKAAMLSSVEMDGAIEYM